MMVIDERKPPVWFDFDAFAMGLNPYQFRVYAEMARLCSKSNRCFKGVDKMAADCGMSKRQLIAARQHLISLGMVVEAPLPDWIEDRRRRCYALTPPSRWHRPSQSPEIGAPHAPIQTRCTTCTYPDELGAPHAPIANHSLDEEERSEEEKREKGHVTRDIANTNAIAVVDVHTNVSLMSDDYGLVNDWSEYLEDTGVTPPSTSSIERGICKLAKARDLNAQSILLILEFIRHDQFWGLRSPQTPEGLLRKSENGRLIIDNVIAQMKTDKRFRERLLWESVADIEINV